MKLEHIAIWTNQLEVMKEFYVKYFQGMPNEKYHNREKKFQSYFITFINGARLELMTSPNVSEKVNSGDNKQYLGLIHLAFEVEGPEKVDAFARLLRDDGITILDDPRKTGDGYYELTLLDPDKNRIEIISR